MINNNERKDAVTNLGNSGMEKMELIVVCLGIVAFRLQRAYSQAIAMLRTVERVATKWCSSHILSYHRLDYSSSTVYYK
jgi:hypothetical protein